METKDKILVSVIIPVFNSEQFLSKCLDSVISQTYKDIEVIIVDDGSTDKSPQICDKYQAKDNRVTVYHKENQGASLARKFGLSMAKGQYIQFVDSDDWIKPNMTEKLVQSAIDNKSDIVWCDVEMVEKEGCHNFQIQYSPSSTAMLKQLYWGKISGWLYNKIINVELLRDIDFPKDWMMEDVYITTQLLLKNGKNSYVPEPLYSYNRLNENAATAQSGSQVLMKAIPNIENCYNYLTQKKVFKQFEKDFSCLAMRLKISILKTKGIKEAKLIFTFAHKHIHSYGLQLPISFIYWLGFNFGKPGELLINTYLRRN